MNMNMNMNGMPNMMMNMGNMGMMGNNGMMNMNMNNMGMGMDMNNMNNMGGMPMMNMNMNNMGGMPMMNMNMNNMGMNMNMNNMGMNMMNMNNMGMNMGMNQNQQVNIEDQGGWNLIFENQNDRQTFNVMISEQKLVKEAISLYYLKSNRNDKCKFIFNNKELFPEMKICQSGLTNMAKILVISIQNLKGANKLF